MTIIRPLLQKKAPLCKGSCRRKPTEGLFFTTLPPLTRSPSPYTGEAKPLSATPASMLRILANPLHRGGKKPREKASRTRKQNTESGGPRILPIPEKARADFQQKTTQNIDKRSIVCYNLCAKYEQHSAKLVLFGLKNARKSTNCFQKKRFL